MIAVLAASSAVTVSLLSRLGWIPIIAIGTDTGNVARNVSIYRNEIHPTEGGAIASETATPVAIIK